MKQIISILALAACTFALQGQSINNSGAHIVSQSGTYWVVDGGNFTLKSESAANTASMANLTITSTATLTLTAASVLPVSGSWLNNGTLSSASGSTVTLNGSVAQSVGGTGTNTFSKLTLNNAAGITLGSNITTNGILDFQNGLLTTGAYSAVIGASGSITNAGTAKYINGKLAQTFSASGSKTFPIGKGGNYRPVTFNYTAVTGTSVVTAEQFESGLTGTLPANTTLLTSNRYWAISQTGGSDPQYYVSLDATGYSPTKPVVILKKSSGGVIESKSTTTPNYTNSALLSDFGDFALGELLCANPTFGGTISADQTGASPFDPALLTSASDPTGHTGTLEGKWMKSTTSSTEGFEDIAGSSGLTYDPASITQDTWYKRVTRVSCKSDWTGAAVSNVVKMTITSASAGGAVTGGTTICSGSTSGVLTLAGNTGTITKWQSSTDGTSWSDKTNTAATFTSGALTATTQFRAVVKNGDSEAANSTSTTVTVNAVSVGGSVTGGTSTIGIGVSSGTMTLSGHTGTIVKWQKMVGSGSWEDIACTAATYSETPSSSGTWQYRAQVKSGACSEAFSAALTITVSSKTAATVTLGDLTQTYSGTGKTATATTSPAGLTVNITYDGSATLPVNAGTYTVVGTISSDTYVGTATGSMVISKAAATVTLSRLTATYDGTQKTPVATTTPAGLTTSLTYTDAAKGRMFPINAGSYLFTATISDTNYQGSTTGTLVISKATATVTLGGLTATYDGNTHLATSSTSPAGMTVNITYNGSSSVPVNAGTYAVVGTISNTNYQGTATASLVISKASQTITLFSAIPEGLRMTQEYELVASASSGLAVTFESSDQALITIVGNTMTVTGDGPVTITATQAGNNNYNAAVAVSQEILTLPTFDNVNSLFSPNGDGMNDNWYIPDIEQYGVLQVTVYNRYGMKVYETNHYSNDWDGTWNGYQLPSASYYYIFKSSELGMFKGVVNIVR